MNRGSGRLNPVLAVVLVLLVAWLLVAVIGLLLKGLFYLFVIGLAAVVVTIAWGAFKTGQRSGRR